MQKLIPLGTSRQTFEDFTFIYFVELPAAALAYYDNSTGSYIYDRQHGHYNITNIVGNSLDVYFYYSGATTLTFNVIGY